MCVHAQFVRVLLFSFGFTNVPYVRVCVCCVSLQIIIHTLYYNQPFVSRLWRTLRNDNVYNCGKHKHAETMPEWGRKAEIAIGACGENRVRSDDLIVCVVSPLDATRCVNICNTWSHGAPARRAVL